MGESFLRGRSARWLRTDASEALTHFRHSERPTHLAVELARDGRRRAPRHEHGPPSCRLVAGHRSFGYRRQARRILKEAETLKQVLADAGDPAKGRLAIATTHVHARYTLTPMFTRFRTRYPRVTIHMLQGNPRQIAHWVATGEADIGPVFQPTITSLIVQDDKPTRGYVQDFIDMVAPRKNSARQIRDVAPSLHPGSYVHQVLKRWCVSVNE